MAIGKYVVNEPFVDPPQSIKLGIVKHLVKVLDKDGECFYDICNAFDGLSEKKKKGGIFDEPQIRKMMNNNTHFPLNMNEIKRDA